MASDSSSEKGKWKRNGGDVSSNKNRISSSDIVSISDDDNVADEIISINVKTFTRKTISLEVQPSDTIRDVKFMIRAKEGIPLERQALIFNKMVLDDTNTIADFDFYNNSTLKLIRKSRGLMQIFVKLPRREAISLEAKPSETIASVKAKIWDTEGIPPGEQALIFNELFLEDSGTLLDFHIKKDSTLKLMFKSGGGLMKIYVKTLIARKPGISLMVKPTDTIGNVKDSIQFQASIPRDEQVLIFNEMVLEDSSALADFKIYMKSTLTLMRKSRGSMKLCIKTLTGKSIIMDVKPSENINNLKAMIHDKEGIPPCKQRLVFGGKLLQDEDTLADHHINEESLVLLVLKL